MRRAREGGADDGSLDPRAAPVDEPDLEESLRRRGLDVVGHDGRRLARAKRVKVEHVLDRDRNGLSGGLFSLLSHTESLGV